MSKSTTKEKQDILIQVKVYPSVRKKLQELADKDRRTLADFVRVNLEKLININ